MASLLSKEKGSKQGLSGSLALTIVVHRYGTLEAYEGGLTDNASQDDMMELYSQILVHSAAFLAVSKADPQ